MGLRDPRFVELLQRERLAEAAMERQAAGAARDGWVKDVGLPLPPEPEPTLGRDVLHSAMTAAVSAVFSIDLLQHDGWKRWLGAALLTLVATMTVSSALRIGRRVVERLRTRREERENTLGL